MLARLPPTQRFRLIMCIYRVVVVGLLTDKEGALLDRLRMPQLKRSAFSTTLHIPDVYRRLLRTIRLVHD